MKRHGFEPSIGLSQGGHITKTCILECILETVGSHY